MLGRKAATAHFGRILFQWTLDAAFMMGKPGGLQDGKAGWIKTTLMLEEYLDGPEVDVDLVFSESHPVFGSITDNWPTVEPWAPIHSLPSGCRHSGLT